MTKVFKKWIYHKTKNPKVIDSDKLEGFKSRGWAESPAEINELKDFNVDPNNTEQVHQFGETIEGVNKAINGALNIDTMSKKELVAYAKESYGVDIDNIKPIKALRTQVKELAGV